MAHTIRGTYDQFDSAKEAATHYRRRRTEQYYIMSDNGLQRKKYICPCCGKQVFKRGENGHSEGFDGNRCIYHPRLKKSVVMHYTCAWGTLLTEVFKKSQVYA